MIIVVTGKIGSGKSTCSQTLAQALAPRGYLLVDADDIAKGLRHAQPWREAARSIFGSEDPSQVSRGCFLDPAKRSAFEQACMPHWKAAIDHALAQGPNLIVDFPLALESQFALAQADLIVGVDASRETRKARAMARLGWEPERFDGADGAQVGARAKMSFCDIELANDGPAHELRDSAERLARSVGALDDIRPLAEPIVGRLGWRSVARAHCQPWRHYHDGTHLKALFDAIDPAFASDPACVMAILHHDVVYDVGAGYARNEAESCKALSRAARDFFPQWLDLPESDAGFGALALAGAMIDSTKGHRIDDPWLLACPRRLARAQAFLDADLAILGRSSDEEFWAYDEQIGREFGAVAPEIYHQARAQAMASFAERGALFLTERARPWERLAKARLSQLIDKHQRIHAGLVGATQEKP